MSQIQRLVLKARYRLWCRQLDKFAAKSGMERARLLDQGDPMARDILGATSRPTRGCSCYIWWIDACRCGGRPIKVAGYIR